MQLGLHNPSPLTIIPARSRQVRLEGPMFPRLMLVSLLVAAPAVTLAAAPSAQEHTDGLLNTFKKLKADKGNLTAADKATNEKNLSELDRQFDFHEICSKIISSRADKFSATEKATFEKKFHELVRAGAFIDSGDFFRKAKIEFKPTKTIGETQGVPVHVTIAADDVDETVEIRWRQTDGVWHVEDVLLDGDSLVKDYQNQVARIVDKRGVAGVIKTLDDKLAAVKKKRAEQR